MAHAERERLEAPLEEETRVGIERAAEVIELVLDLLDELAPADDDARDDVAVAVEVLRGAVEDEVEAALDRADVDGAREGTVDDRDEPMRAAERGRGVEVGDGDERGSRGSRRRAGASKAGGRAATRRDRRRRRRCARRRSARDPG
jgi:hypothetical protein